LIKVLGAVLLACAASASFAADENQLDGSPSLFTVMAAINAVGYDAELDSPSNSAVRQMVRQAVAAKNPPVIPELKQFFADHRRRDWTGELSQYVSFALSVDGPPAFRYRYKPEELPPDVVPLNGFEKLLARFYAEAGIDELWRKAQPAFEEAIARYHQPAMAVLTEVNAYLRNTSRAGPMGTRFQVYVELLAAPNQVQTRSYKGDYFVVITPSAEVQAEEIRHAYLHYLVDTWAARYSGEIEKLRSLIDYAQAAPALEDYYKEDFLLLATESLIKALEARLVPSSRRAAVIDEAVSEGFILTAAFAEALPVYEGQEQSLRFYLPEVMKSIDLNREVKRLDNVQFVSERRVRKVRVVPAERKVELTGAQKTLEDAEQLYSEKDLDKAREVFLRVLRETDEKPVHAKAYFGLARIAALKNDPELAQQLFEKTIESAPDDYVMAWAHVYLGRLADAAGERDRATRHYQAALGVREGPGTARQAAEKGLQQEFKKQN
jgi:tetratricopeptide (TPR) repeat protein